MRSHRFKTAMISCALMVAAMTAGFAQFKAGDGLYVVVNFVPRECKTKVDGFYRVSTDGKISLTSINMQLAVDREIKLVSEDLRRAILQYCRQTFPDGSAFPDLDIISEADVQKAGTDIAVMGQARKPGLVPMKDGLTVWQALLAAGGPNEFSALRHVAILRKHKVMDCNMEKVEDMKTLLQSGDLIMIPRKLMVAETEY